MLYFFFTGFGNFIESFGSWGQRMTSPCQAYPCGSPPKQTWNVTSRRNEKAIFCGYPCPPAESKLKEAEVNAQKLKAPRASFFPPSFPPFYRLSKKIFAASPAPCSPAQEDCCPAAETFEIC